MAVIPKKRKGKRDFRAEFKYFTLRLGPAENPSIAEDGSGAKPDCSRPIKKEQKNQTRLTAVCVCHSEKQEETKGSII